MRLQSCRQGAGLSRGAGASSSGAAAAGGQHPQGAQAHQREALGFRHAVDDHRGGVVHRRGHVRQAARQQARVARHRKHPQRLLGGHAGRRGAVDRGVGFGHAEVQARVQVEVQHEHFLGVDHRGQLGRQARQEEGQHLGDAGAGHRNVAAGVGHAVVGVGRGAGAITPVQHDVTIGGARGGGRQVELELAGDAGERQVERAVVVQEVGKGVVRAEIGRGLAVGRVGGTCGKEAGDCADSQYSFLKGHAGIPPGLKY